VFNLFTTVADLAAVNVMLHWGLGHSVLFTPTLPRKRLYQILRDLKR